MSDGLRFSERNVLSVPAPTRGRVLYQSAAGPTGFRLMVTATGHRTYYLQYKPRGRSGARWLKLGRVEDVSYKHAKSMAEAARGLVAQGRDPFAEDQAERAARNDAGVVTLGECVHYFLASNRERLDAKTVRAYEQTRDALPRSFIGLPAEDATPALFREAVHATTTAPVMQNRHMSRLKAVLRFAHAEHKITRLPALVGMRRPHAEARRERVLTEDEIRALWEAVDLAAPSMPRGGRAFAASLRTMLLLGTRLGETTLATWDEIDLDGRTPRSQAIHQGQPVWYIPAEHRKGERGRRRSHWVPLPDLAVSVLRELQALTGDKPLVFWKAGYSGRTYMLGKLLAVMSGLGHARPWTFHDLRRTCSTWLGEIGCPQEVNDLILGHSRKGVIAHYDHSQRIAERADWLRRWSGRVAEIVGVQVTAEPVLHLYETAAGLPEIKTEREPDNGRRYVGAFAASEALRRATELTRVPPRAR